MVVTETLKAFENDSYDNMDLSVIKSTILYVWTVKSSKSVKVNKLPYIANN